MTEETNQNSKLPPIRSLLEQLSYDVETCKTQLFNLVKGFYDLPSNEDNSRNLPLENHRRFAEIIGDLMDQQFLDYLLTNLILSEDSNNKIVDVYPLRGASALFPGIDNEELDNVLLGLANSEAIDYKRMPIGIGRNSEDKTQAEIYYPEGGVQEEDKNAIYRIKDFGIATGGTTVALVEQLIKAGVNVSNIIVQGAIGTKMAYDKLTELGVNVLFAVEGQMPIEKNLDEKGDDACYVTEIRPCPENDQITYNNDPPWTSINPKDWGDECFGGMKGKSAKYEIGAFIEREALIARILGDEGINLEPLRNYLYEKAGIKRRNRIVDLLISKFKDLFN